MRFPAFPTWLALFLVAATTLTGAQQVTADNPSATITSNTELVLVPVQVRGSDGKPIRGLKAADFVLRSDGKPQPIGVFEEPQTSSPAVASVIAAPHSPPGNAGRISNVPDGGMPQQILIIAVDLVNTEFLTQTWAKKQLLKYLGGELPEQHFALVAITRNGLAPIHNFSSDPAVLVQALGRVQNDLGKDTIHEETLGSYAAAGDFATKCSLTDEYSSMMAAFRETQIYGAFAQRMAALATLSSLEQIAQAYAGVPGRKSVIWLTGGMPIFLADAVAGGIKGSSALNGDPELLAYYDRTFAALNNANIAVYGVDVKGIHGDRTYHATGINQAMHNPIYSGGAYGARMVVPPGGYDDEAIKVLSAATGGKSCTANTELKTCIDAAVDDSTSYYMLGFYVPQATRKAGWHKLDVKLQPERGSVHSRTNYYLASRTAPSDKEINRNLREAAAAKIGYTGIAFSIEPQPGEATNSTQPRMVRILMPASSLLLSSGHSLLSYDIATVPLDGKGDPASDLRVIHLNLNADQTQVALSKGWAYFDPVQGTPTQAVKYIIRDNATGHIGSLIVPAPKGSTGG